MKSTEVGVGEIKPAVGPKSHAESPAMVAAFLEDLVAQPEEIRTQVWVASAALTMQDMKELLDQSFQAVTKMAAMLSAAMGEAKEAKQMNEALTTKLSEAFTAVEEVSPCHPWLEQFRST